MLAGEDREDKGEGICPKERARASKIQEASLFKCQGTLRLSTWLSIDVFMHEQLQDP
jgi:hypothetical protein